MHAWSRMVAGLALLFWGFAAGKVQAEEATLAQKVDQILAENHLPGAALAVVGPSGVLWQHVYGYADLEHRRPMTAATVFPMGSVSKSLIGLAFMQLQEQGLVDIDTPVAAVVPEIVLENPWAAKHPLTIAHLLEHRSGLQDLWPRWVATEGTNRPLLELLREPGWTTKLRWPPGKVYLYCQQNYLLAGYILERITGKPFEDAIQSLVLEPLGMQTSGFHETPATAAQKVVGYGTKGPLAPYEISPRPAGAFRSNLADMISYVQLHINGGAFRGRRLLSEAGLTRIETEKTSGATARGLATGYGLGNWSQATEFGIFHGHGGGVGGSFVGFSYSRERHIGGVFLVNGFYGSEPVNKATAAIGKLMRAAYINGPTAVAPPASRLDDGMAGDLGGYYRPVDTSARPLAAVETLASGAVVVATGNGFTLKPLMGAPLNFLHVRGALFRGENDTAATAFFEDKGNGAAVLQIGTLQFVKMSAATVYGPVVGLSLAALVMAAFFVWGAIAAASSRGRALLGHAGWARVPLLLAITSGAAQLATFLVLFSSQSVYLGCTKNLLTEAFTACSLAFALATALALVGTLYRSRCLGGPVATALHLGALAACIGFVGYLAQFGVIGLTPWGS